MGQLQGGSSFLGYINVKQDMTTSQERHCDTVHQNQLDFTALGYKSS